MIDIETDTVNQRCVIKSDKMVSEIYVQKEESGYSFLELGSKRVLCLVSYQVDTLV